MSILESNNVTRNTIHVALAFHDPKGTYSTHAGVVMASIFDHTKSPVRVHIFHDNTLTDHNRRLLLETAESFNQQAAFHDVSHYIKQLEDIASLMALNVLTIGTFFRLAIPDILPLDKVIYLDCDIVVNLDIQELWDIPLEGYSFAGVADVPCARFSRTAFNRRLMGCDTENYINAGVLLMNLPRIKEKFDIRQGFMWFKRHWHCAKFLDQDLINSYFRGDIKFIEGKFNITSCGFDSSTNVDSILHITGFDKPWVVLKKSVVGRLYWRAFFNTAWGRLKPEEIVDLITGIAEKSPHTHKRTAQCYKKIFYRLCQDIFFNSVFRSIALSVKILYYKIKSFLTREESERA